MAPSASDHMKRIGVHDDWDTPVEVFQEACRLSGLAPVVDVCATRANAKCRRFFDAESDGLKARWPRGAVWCNPPYSNVTAWVRRAYEHSLNGHAALCLTYNKTDTRWFHEYVWPYARIWWWRGRIRFYKDGVLYGPAPYPSMLFAFGPEFGGRRA